MAAEVPFVRPPLQTGQIDAGAAVRALTWQGTAMLANWTLGQGGQVVSAFTLLSGGPGTASTWGAATLTGAAGNRYTSEVRIFPRAQAVQRTWALTLTVAAAAAGEAAVSCVVEIPRGSNTSTVAIHTERGQPYLFTETLSAQSDTETSVKIMLKPDGDIYVSSISCWETPRVELETGTTALGVNVNQFSGGQPIYETPYTNAASAMSQEQLTGRRCSLKHHAHVTEVNSSVASAVSGGWVEEWNLAAASQMWSLAAPALGRKIATTATTATMKCKVLAWRESGFGNTATMFLSSSVNGAGNSVSITATTPTWYTVPSIGIDCEDMASTDGRQTKTVPAWDVVSLNIDGSGTEGDTTYFGSMVWYEEHSVKSATSR